MGGSKMSASRLFPWMGKAGRPRRHPAPPRPATIPINGMEKRKNVTEGESVTACRILGKSPGSEYRLEPGAGSLRVIF